MHGLMKTFPTVDVWRGSVNDEERSTILYELGWDAILGLVRVDEGPHEDVKFVKVKIRGHFVNAIVNENITPRYCVPYDWFLFGTAPT
jgi:hypothetical protein